MQKFNDWVSIQEGNLDPPAHEMGEDGLDNHGLVRKRLEMLLSELEKRRIPKEEQIIIIQKVLESMGQKGQELNKADQLQAMDPSQQSTPPQQSPQVPNPSIPLPQGQPQQSIPM